MIRDETEGGAGAAGDSPTPVQAPNPAGPGAGSPAPGLLDRLARRLVRSRLARVTDGRLRLLDAGGEETYGPGTAPPEAEIRVHHPAFYRRFALGGGLGAAAAYMDGHWSADDLTAVIRLAARNRGVLVRRDGVWAWLAAPFAKLYHALRSNTRRGSRRNIEVHYDLGDDFFALFLDDTLTYSCALFDPPGIGLAEAQEAKLDRLCRKLALSPDDHVLEIGTGWGSFALHAACNYGCRVTTTTISPAQLRRARQRVAEAGLADRVEVIDRDYRDLTGRFDKLVSIEMIEGVGHRFLDTFFRVAGERLAPGGLMGLQAITIADRFYEQARRSVDFIQRYVFPGGAIPSVGSLAAAVARATDMTVIHLEDIGVHYARTLACWRRRLADNLPAAREMGFSERFLRMWEYYFCYCEGGFAERTLGDVQMVLAKPGVRRPPILGRI